MKYKAVKLVQFLSVAYILLVTCTKIGQLGRFGGAVDPVTGFIIDVDSEENTAKGVIMWYGQVRAVVASSTLQMILLGISRCSAFFMYPALVLVYLTKLRATGTYLASTKFNMFLYQDLHKLHTYCGWVILLDSCVHSACHATRWYLQGNLTRLLTGHVSGITGMLIVLSTLLTCLPMILFKHRIKYEIRKMMHYFFWLFGIALCFHAPKSAIPNGGFCGYIFPTLLVWYTVDNLYCSFFMTELIETCIYHTLPCGVQVTVAVSKRFQNHSAAGGYCYLCFPWVDRFQWHAFSLFENPDAPEERQIFIQKMGDWTSKVHELLQRNSVRPVLIQGPFPSPYKNAIRYDNQILVALGIGITPALSVLRAQKAFRCVNFVWAVRDGDLLEFFLEHRYLENLGWVLIFYTGKKDLPSSVWHLIENFPNKNVQIIRSRPNLAHVIPNLIYGYEFAKEVGEKKSFDTFRSIRFNNKSLTDLPHDDAQDTVEDSEKSSTVDNDEIGTEVIIDMDAAYSLGTADHDVAQTERKSTLTEDNRMLESLTKCVQIVKTSSGKRGSMLKGVSMGVFSIETDRGSAMKQQWDGVKNHEGSSYLWMDAIEGAKEFVQDLDEEKIKATWGVLYCGGKNTLLTSLQEVTTELDIKLYEESFNW